jgi:hypothetical protein
MPLFVFMTGSPFFLKNFMHTLGHFDIYGCSVAIGLLLLPAGSIFFVALAAIGSMVLILIHHIHLLTYVPTIGVIVLLRHYLARGFDGKNLTFGIAATICIGVLFFIVQFMGTMPVSEAEFVRYLESRMADPSQVSLLSFSYIWYQPLAKEISDTWQRMPWNLLGVPAYALLIGLHWPLWRYFAELSRSLADDLHRHLVMAGIVAVSAGYLIMFAIVFDYSRWVSNWMVCLFLILHAVKTLPAEPTAPSIPMEDQKTFLLGWIVTLVPRVGVVRPF